MSTIGFYDIGANPKYGYDEVLLCTNNSITHEELNELVGWDDCLTRLRKEVEAFSHELDKVLDNISHMDKLVFATAILRRDGQYFLQNHTWCSDCNVEISVLQKLTINPLIHALQVTAGAWAGKIKPLMDNLFDKLSPNDELRLIIGAYNRMDAYHNGFVRTGMYHIDTPVFYGNTDISQNAFQNLSSCFECITRMGDDACRWLDTADESVLSVLRDTDSHHRLSIEIQLVDISNIEHSQTGVWQMNQVTYCTDQAITRERIAQMKGLASLQDTLHERVGQWLANNGDALRAFTNAMGQKEKLRFIIGVQSLMSDSAATRQKGEQV